MANWQSSKVKFTTFLCAAVLGLHYSATAAPELGQVWPDIIPLPIGDVVTEPPVDGGASALTDGIVRNGVYSPHLREISMLAAMSTLTFDLNGVHRLEQLLINFAAPRHPGQIIISIGQDRKRFMPVRTVSFDFEREGRLEEYPYFPPMDGIRDDILMIETDAAGMRTLVVDLDVSAAWLRLDFVHQTAVAEIAVVGKKETGIAQAPEPIWAARPNFHFNHARHQDLSWRAVAAGRVDLMDTAVVRVAGQAKDDWAKVLRDGKRYEGRVYESPGAIRINRSGVHVDLGRLRPVGDILIRGIFGGPWNYPATGWEVMASEDGERFKSVAELRAYPEESDVEADVHWPYIGTNYHHQVIHLPVNVDSRYLLVRPQNRMYIDELAVLEGAVSRPLETAIGRVRDDWQPGVRAHVPGGKLTLASGLWMPFYYELSDRRAADVRAADGGGDYETVLELPAAIDVHQMTLMDEVVRQGRPYRRWRRVYAENWSRSLFLTTKLSPGTSLSGTLSVWRNGKVLMNVALPIEVIDIPPVPPFKNLHISLAWMPDLIWGSHWPDAPKTYQRLGFNSLPIATNYSDHRDPSQAVVRQTAAALQQARDIGLEICAVHSPGPPHPLPEACTHVKHTGPGVDVLTLDQPPDEIDELEAELDGGPSVNYFGGYCIGYSGEHLTDDAKELAGRLMAARPSRIFLDIERFKYWYDFQHTCLRCQALMDKMGMNWDDYRRHRGLFIAEQWRRAIVEEAKAMSVPLPPIGHYRTVPNRRFNDGLFDWALLHPKHVQTAMPEIYAAIDVERTIAILDEMRRTVAGESIPWLTPATYGEFDARKMRDQVLEAFMRGSAGIAYYRFAEFNAEKFAYHAEALRWLQPYEALIRDGQVVSGLQIDGGPTNAHVIGRQQGSDSLILVSYYRQYLNPGPFEIKVTVPKHAQGIIKEIHTGNLVPLEDGQFVATLGKVRAALYVVRKP